MANPDRQIMTLFYQICESVRQAEFDRDLGKARGKTGEQGGHMQAAEDQGRRHGESAARLRPVALRRALCFVEFREDTTCPLEKARSRVSQADLPGSAMEQPGAQAGFKGGDLA